MNIYSPNTAFVYKWTHLPTLKWYIGSRTAKGCHPEDGYLCSSRNIKPLIVESPAEWKREIIATGTSEEMLTLETALLLLFNAKYDPRSFNQHNGDGKFTTRGVAPHNKGKKYSTGKVSPFLGKKRPEISAARKGQPAHNKGIPMSEDQKCVVSYPDWGVHREEGHA